MGSVESPDGENELRRVSVKVPLPLAGPFDYLVPPGLEVAEGAIVQVSFGRLSVAAVVWGAGTGDVGPERLKTIDAVRDIPPLAEEGRRFVDWVAAYVMSPAGSVLRMTLSTPAALEPPAPLSAYRLAPGSVGELRLTPARRRVLEVAADGFARAAADLAREAGCTTSVVSGLVKAGRLEQVAVPRLAALDRLDPDRPAPDLRPDQIEAAAALTRRAGTRRFSATLLEGPTGSGKTEVYFEALAAVLRQGRQALVLLPEIALSAQWVARFADRFGGAPLLWHSDVGAGQRAQGWRAVAEGRARVVVGARSALFLPYSDLGLIIVDEEHEAAFKQEDGVHYHARDMGVVRAREGEFAIILASATPSLETVANCRAQRYGHVTLDRRHFDAAAPQVELIDLRRQRPPKGRFLAPPLVEAITAALERGEQAMLFLNRRGYAPLTVCRACGERVGCPHCDAWLVDHRLAGRLRCHHCGYEIRRPQSCPSCAEADSFMACGPGVERIAEEVDTVLPDARWFVATSDTVRRPSDMEALRQAVADGSVNLLIGTQLLAKGHHFPDLTFVGVVDADLGFAGGDFRAFERTHQLLEQVAGRTGRGGKPGIAWLQTRDPGHPVLAALAGGDREAFIEQQLASRRRAGLPPFGRLASLVFSGPDRETVERQAQAAARAAPTRPGLNVLGPTEPPIALLRGHHRRRILIQARRGLPLQDIIGDWLGRLRLPSTVRLTVDIDPQSFF